MGYLTVLVILGNSGFDRTVDPIEVSMPSQVPQPRIVAAASFASLLALTLATPVLPASATSLTTSTPAAPGAVLSAGTGRLTPALRAEIDRVVAVSRSTTARVSPRSGPAALVAGQVRCADFEGQTYCLHTGWTTQPQAEVVNRTTAAVRAADARTTGRENTGDTELLTSLRRAAALSPRERAAEERAELTAAATSVAKVWLLRHQVQGTPLPAGFLDRHPEVTTSRPASTTYRTGTTASPTSTSGSVAADGTKTAADYPERAAVLSTSRVSEQLRSYWCGPASMQMIAWGWHGAIQGQSTWASRLGTTRSGTAISQMVRVTNAYTGWDRSDFAGPYIILDISDWSYAQWMVLNMRHVVDYRAPVILHPVLHKEFFPYLDDDASGHFQVGRGYDMRGDQYNLLSYFEPWNQQRFDPSEPYIARVQWRSAYRSYRANQAHPQQNIGV